MTKADETRRRLKRRADELGIDLQAAVQYYAMERFLFRLSKSRWSDKLVIKGAAMLRVWDARLRVQHATSTSWVASRTHRAQCDRLFPNA